MLKKFFLMVILLSISTLTLADVRIGTWNTMRLGSGNDKNYQALATVAGNFDFLAVQEVMNEEGIEQFKNALERQTGESWELLSSHLVGRGSYKEMYSFLWKKSKVDYVDGAVVYLDRDDAFDREPFSARFVEKSTGQKFVAATVHIHYGNSDADRTPEIKSLRDYWDWIGQVYPDSKNVMLMGDFNMNPSDPSWAALKEVATPLITDGASTLGLANGRYSSLFDNVWVAKSSISAFSKANVVKYPSMLSISNAEARKSVSDHAPLFLTMHTNGRVVSTPTPQVSQRANPSNQSMQIASAPTSTSSAMLVHGNRNSKIYHLPGCPNYEMSSANLVTFQTANEAESAGYRMAKNCGR